MPRSPARFTAALLILAATAAFAIGAALERHSSATEHAVEQPPGTSRLTNQVPPTTRTPTTTDPASPTRDTDHGGDSDQDHHAGATTVPTTSAPTTTLTTGATRQADGGHDQDADGGTEVGSTGRTAGAAEHAELVFGLNPESTALVTAAVVVSVLAAVAILTLGMSWLAVVIAVAMLAFAALDIREIVHQLGESHGELAVVAILVALLHVLAALATAQVARTRHRAEHPG